MKKHLPPTLLALFMAVSASADKTWTGAVSPNWSNPANWAEGAIPTDGESVTLTAHTPFAPTLLDIPNLHINTLFFDTTQNQDHPLTGEPFYIQKFGETEPAATVITNTILNDVILDAPMVGVHFSRANGQDKHVLHLAGTVSDDGRGYGFGVGQDAHNILLSGTNTFRGPCRIEFGSLYFYQDANLGLPPSSVEAHSIYNSWGPGNVVLKPESKHFHRMFIHENRGIFKTIRFASGLEAFVQSPLSEMLGRDSGVIINSYGTFDPATVGISMIHLSGTSPDIGHIEINNNVLVKLEEDVQIGSSNELIRVYFGAVDLNGLTLPNTLAFYNSGTEKHAAFFNSNRAQESLLTGDYTPLYQYEGFFFGGPGDIRLEGNIRIDQTSNPNNKFDLWREGSGKLTIAGNSDYNRDAVFESGTTILDHTSNNSPKLNPNGKLVLGPCNLTLLGGDSAPATETVTRLNVDNYTSLGAISLNVIAGDADASLTFSTFDKLNNGKKPVDFITQSTGSGTASFIATELTNDAAFGGITPIITWNHGTTWAQVLPDGSIGPMDASIFSSTPDSGSLFDAPAGETTLPKNISFRGIRSNDPAGATITIAEGRTTTLTAYNNGSAVLVTPQSGDVTLRGGTLKNSSYHNPITFFNYNPEATVRVESLVQGQVNLGVHSVGPGKVILANDENGFEGFVMATAGSTLEFTSISPVGIRSACGIGTHDNTLTVGEDSTLRYIGTLQDGHSTDKKLDIVGSGTLDASGAGPLHFTRQDFATTYTTRYKKCFDLTLTGSGEGIIDGSITLGYWGSLRKTGSGRWTLHATNSLFYYPTFLDEGTLALDGALPSDVEIAPAGTLESPGCTLRRNLTTSGTLRYQASADSTPISVWGKATLGGALEVNGRFAEPITLLTAENGIEGEFSEIPPHMKVRYTATSVIVERDAPTLIFVR